MSIARDPALMIGLPADDLFDKYTTELDDNLEEWGMERINTLYDGDLNAWIIGYEMATEMYIDNLECHMETIKAKAAEFTKFTGKRPRLIAAISVW